MVSKLDINISRADLHGLKPRGNLFLIFILNNMCTHIQHQQYFFQNDYFSTLVCKYIVRNNCHVKKNDNCQMLWVLYNSILMMTINVNCIQL